MLLEHTKTNLSTVHALYSDPEEKLKDPLLAEMERFPISQFQTEDGVAHDLWAVSEPKLVGKVTSFLCKLPLYIADGHHRYQTALEYSRRLESRGEITDEDDPRNFLMMMIVEMENPGLSVLPVHRVVLAGEGARIEGMMSAVEQFFEVQKLEVPRGARSGQVFHLLKEVEIAGKSTMAFAVFTSEPDCFRLFVMKPGVDAGDLVEGRFSPTYKRLDVSVLHKLVIEGAMGISPDRKSVEENLVFTKDPLEAVRLVDSGKGLAAFLMNAPRVEEVKTVADEGEKMPQKSTYFIPKPCSGVVMNRITTW
jgi:uncharacterized protein (DUF1015 family)